jgi:hypothetical protein
VSESESVSDLPDYDETTKPTNPKDTLGSEKLPLHLFPSTAIAMGSLAFLNGALKYGRTNWREAGVRASIYIDALIRHAEACFEGEENDPSDGVPHLAAMLACTAIIIDARTAGKLIDDRAYNGKGYHKLVEELTPIVTMLKERHGRHTPKHYTIGDNDAKT